MAKAVELQRLLEEDEGAASLLCLVETQQKYRKVDFSKCYTMLDKMRHINDKKGGGLTMLMREQVGYMLREVGCGDCDVMRAELSIGSLALNIFLVYLDGREEQRAERTYGALEIEIQNLRETDPRIILGDFNSHVGFLGEQRLNKKGTKLLNFVDRFNLILLNGDERCLGEYTWMEGEQKSAIDFVLTNQAAYQHFKCMKIDEVKEKYDLSDHCLIETIFQIREENCITSKKQITTEYYKTNCQQLKSQFLCSMERDILQQEGDIDEEILESLMKKNCECILKRKMKKKLSKEGIQKEPIWMNETIRKEIKLRKQYNREKRHASGEKKAELEQEYKNQKNKVQTMIKKEKTDHEEKITQEIKLSKERSKKMFEMINKLRGKDKKNSNEEIFVYSDEGVKMEGEAAVKKMESYWTSIYRRHDNDIDAEWNDEQRRIYEIEEGSANYLMKFNNEWGSMIVPKNLTEHYDLVARVVHMEEDFAAAYFRTMLFPAYLEEHMEVLDGRIVSSSVEKMTWVEWRESDVMEALRRIKKNKQAGPDLMKGDILKWLIESKICLRVLAKAMNMIVQTGECPSSWKRSKTVMIPKNHKPEANQHRPIALTNATYKLLMGLLKDQLYEHLVNIREMNDLQAGFSKGRRMEDNIFVLEYCIRDSKRRKKELIVMAVDFEKAFDSVDRRSLIAGLKRCKCDPLVINVIANLYKGDTTEVYMKNQKLFEIEATSGIRQGCTLSPLLFVIVVNEVIRSLQQSKLGFRNKEVYIPALFYADDGLILSNDRDEMEKMMTLMRTVVGKCGLLISEVKSECLIINRKGNWQEKIGNVKVVNSIKYLGVHVTDSRNYFKNHKVKKTDLARKMCNMTFSVISRCCNKLMIGKTFWKNIVLPSILMASSVLVWTKGELEILQKIENSVWRQVLGGPSYVAVEALRGEIGCSTFDERDKKNKLCYANYIRKGDGGLVQKVFDLRMEDRGDPWIRQLRQHLNQINMNYNTLGRLDGKDVKKEVYTWGESQWRRTMEEKSTLEMYRTNKEIIREEPMYDNTHGSMLLFRARTNSLPLNWRKRFVSEEVLCQICWEEEETLNHFLRRCPGLERIRTQHGMNDIEMRNLLLFGGGGEGAIGNTKRYLADIWRRRERAREQVRREQD